MRQLSLSNSAMSQEGAEKYRESLVLELGDISKVENKLDRQGLEDLRLM